MASRPAVAPWQGIEFALFFSFAALNLVWFPLRNVSNAVDEFIGFETLEAVRRGGHIAIMLALLVGLPLSVFLLLANFAVVRSSGDLHFPPRAVSALRARTAPAGAADGILARATAQSSCAAATTPIGELTIYNFPYIVVPVALRPWRPDDHSRHCFQDLPRRDL